MSGSQHPYQQNFGSPVQNEMRSQYGGPRGTPLSGLSSPNQQPAGMASPQTYGVNMQTPIDSPISAASQQQSSAPPTPQQIQMQQRQSQMQPQQTDMSQASQQLQQTQSPQGPNQVQSALSQQASMQVQGSQASSAVPGQVSSRIPTADGSTAVPSAGSIPAAAVSVPAPSSHATQQINTALLCKCGQETVQEIVSKIHETFQQILRNLMPPNGTAGGANMSSEKRQKLKEQIQSIKLLFKRLRVIYDKCNDNSQLQGMEYMHIESFIPLKEEWDMKTSEERKTSETYRLAVEECKDLIDQVIMKNMQLKEIIDHLRKIIWEVNTMLTMRKS